MSNYCNPNRRTRAQVLAARATPNGCCERHANNTVCDCLDEADAEQSECPECQGAGVTHDAYPGGWSECDTCHGRGQVYVPGVGLDAEDDPICPACHGTGYVNNGDSELHPCGRCITEGR